MKYLLLTILCCLAVGTGAAARRPKSELKLMSYNIRYAGAKDDTGEKSWEARREASLAMIRRERPDVIGLQEPRTPQVDYLLERLDEYGHVLAGNTRDGYLMILYLRSKFDLLDSGRFWLSDTPDVRSKGWDGRCVRPTVWVRLRDKITGGEFFYFDTHLDHKGDQARMQGATLNVAQMKRLAGEQCAVFISGDMNAEKGAPNARFLEPFESWMASAREAAPETDGKASFNGFGLTPLHRLDHIYFRNAVPLRYQTLDGADYGVRYISDHYPIVCTFRYR